MLQRDVPPARLMSIGVTMKHFFIILAALIILAPVAAGEESPKPFRFYLGVGATAVAAPEIFRDDHKTGFHLVTILGYSLTKHIEMMGRLEFQFVSVDVEERFGSNVFFDGGGIDMAMLGIDTRFSARKTSAAVRPFALIGGGVSRMSQSNIVTDLAFEQYAPLLIDTQDGFYYNIGAGVTLKPMANLTGFLLLRYLEVGQDGENLRFIPITLGVQF